MRKLGRVIKIRGGRRLIIKANFAPRILQTVYDDRLRPIGRVYDVFGPVNSPYVSVLVNHEISENGIELFLNKFLYIKVSSKRIKKGKRR